MFRATIALLTLLACVSAHADDNTLHIFNFTDYTSAPMLKKFTRETGVRVSLDTYDINETLLAKLRSGSRGYDIAVASSDLIPILIAERLIQPVDVSALPNYQHLDPRWKHTPWDPGNAYSIPWQIGLTSYIVDRNIYKGPADSLQLLFDPPPELRGLVGMFASPFEVISLALVYLDRPPCNTNPVDLRAAYELLKKQQQYVKIYSSSGILERAVAGETAVSQIANGEALRARLKKPSLQFVFAKEGGVAWVDSIVVPINAAHRDLARQFIAFMMDASNAAMETLAGGYPTGVSDEDSFLPKEVSQATELQIPVGFKAVLTPTCSQAAIRKYDLLWTRLRQ